MQTGDTFVCTHGSLDRLERVYHLLVIATLSDRPPDALAILTLRQRFAVEFGTLMHALEEDLRPSKHRLLQKDLQGRLKTVRIRLMTYTLAWQPAQIEADPVAYREAAQTMADMIWSFISDARMRLMQAGVERTAERALGG